MKSVVYRGWPKTLANYEDEEVLCLCPRDYAGRCAVWHPDEDYPAPLSLRVWHDMNEYGRYLSVRYYLFDLELSEQEMREAYVMQVMGLGEAEYAVVSSEATGYLWTDDDLKVGGHDLLAELGSYGECFCQLEIDYSQEPKPS